MPGESTTEVDSSVRPASASPTSRSVPVRFPAGSRLPASNPTAGPRVTSDSPIDAPPRGLHDASALPSPTVDAPEAFPSIDAGRSPAETPPLDADVAVAKCQGVAELGLCWYLSKPGDSCNDACASHGGFDKRCQDLVGTPLQGGDLASCMLVLAGLGSEGMVYPAARYDGVGLGCHRWSDETNYWVESPNLALFSGDSSAPSAAIACACLK